MDDLDIVSLRVEEKKRKGATPGGWTSDNNLEYILIKILPAVVIETQQLPKNKKIKNKGAFGKGTMRESTRARSNHRLRRRSSNRSHHLPLRC